MKTDQVQDMIRWLNSQINHANEVIGESHQTSNYGRESMYEGMRDAFLRCLNKLQSEY